MGENSPAQTLRQEIRAGRFEVPTSGQALGFVQANLVVVPEESAFDFLLFCQRNPKPCPLLEVVEAGSVEPRRLAPGADLRKDLPRYRVFRDGKMTEEPTDVAAIWRDDFVSFLLGCSFSFEKALLDAGLALRNIELKQNVPMYRTNIACRPAGAFEGPMVVSMRPFSPEQAIRAALVTGRFPEVHGAPFHMSTPQTIGVSDLERPDYGDALPVREGEIPVFWACGVTPQEVLLRAKLPLAITHSPGHMFVTDLRDNELPWYREMVR